MCVETGNFRFCNLAKPVGSWNCLLLEEQMCWPPWPWWSVREVGAGLGQEMEMRVVSGCYSSNFSVHMSLLESLLRCRIWFNRPGGVTWDSLFLTHSAAMPVLLAMDHALSSEGAYSSGWLCAKVAFAAGPVLTWCFSICTFLCCASSW